MNQTCQLYLISPARINDPALFAAHFEAALSAGPVAAFQLRLKAGDGVSAPDRAEVMAVGAHLLPIAKAHDVAFILNDDPALAREIGADGVHIGQGDAPYGVARGAMGDDGVVGVTCHDSMHLAMEAGEAGADYVAFGAFFETDTKQAPSRAPLALLENWSHVTTVPCVAIGGITPENCGPLVTAGADFLAVSASVWQNAAGPADAIEKFNQAFVR